MKTTSSLTRKVNYLRWVARIIGTFLVAFFLLFFISDIINKGGLHIPDLGLWLMTIFFLLGQVGILIAWRWEGIGGFLAVFSIIVAILLNLFWVQVEASRSTIAIAFSFWLIPAFLFIYCWWSTRKQY